MAHNGKRVQVNLYDIQFSKDYAFLNYLKTGQAWDFSDNSGCVDRSVCDTDGYPTVISHGGFRTALNLPSQASVPGNYKIKWEGSGTVTVGGTLVSGSFSGSNGSATFTPTADDSFIFSITATSASPNHIHNVRICHVNEEALLDSGEVFRPDFLALMEQVGVIRFLDYQRANGSQITAWSERCPTTYWSYYDDQYPTGILDVLATYSTATMTYTAGVSSFSLVDKAKAIIKFDTDQPGFTVSGAASGTGAVIRLTVSSTTNIVTGNVVFIRDVGGLSAANGVQTVTVIDGTHLELQGTTFAATYTSGGEGQVEVKLNVNGTGAKYMRQIGGSRVVFSFDNYYHNDTNYTCAVYDATLDVFCCATAHFNTKGIQTGFPPELMVSLCNKVNAHPWAVWPVYVLDANLAAPVKGDLTDYTTSLITYFRDNLNSGLIPRFEPPNETWNFVMGQTDYAQNRGVLRGGNYHDSYGMWASLLGQIASDVYSADRTRYQVLCGYQTFGGQPTERLECPIYVAAGKSASKNWVTHINVAGYFNSDYYGTATETTLAGDWAVGTAPQKAAAIDTYLQQALVTGVNRFDTIPKLLIVLTAFATFASGYGLKVCQYEGGFSPDLGANNAFRLASKFGPALQDITITQYENFAAAGSNTEFPSEYVFSGLNGAWTIWDPSIYYAGIPPRWAALLEWNAATEVLSPLLALRLRLHG